MITQMFITGFLLSLSLCLDIGIANMAIIRTGLELGFRHSFSLGVGTAIGDLTYAGLSLTVLSWILGNPVIRITLWLVGTCMLLYLTIHTVKSAWQSTSFGVNQAPLRATASTSINAFTLGVSLALASPSSILWFATVGGSIIAATGSHHHSPVTYVALLGGFFLAGCLWSFAVAYVSSQIRQWIKPIVMRLVSLASALLLFYFAVRVFLQGLSFAIGSH